MKIKEIENAIESYDKSIKINPHFTTAWYNRGIALSKLGKYRKAIESYDNALETPFRGIENHKFSKGLKIGVDNTKRYYAYKAWQI